MRSDVAEALSDLELVPGGARARLRFPPELPVFAGHFPGFPLVPGVYLVEGARLLGEHALGRSLIILAVETAKFTAVVGPGDWVEATAALDEHAGAILCDARFRCRGLDAARIKLRLHSPPPNENRACRGS